MKRMFLAAMTAVLLVAPGAQADVVSDRAAAILIWPDIVVGDFFNTEVDTIVQISNTSDQPILAHCFYENANAHCAATGQVCQTPQECCVDPFGCSPCVPGWIETDFRVRLTPQQPLGWVASQGLLEPPLTGQPFGPNPPFGPDGVSSNAGTRVPPTSETPYTGALKCIAINDDGTPSDRNVLKGEATWVDNDDVPGDVLKHNAVGIQAIEGAVNEDKELILGGDGAEYNGCSNYLIVNHMFDFGIHPVVEDHISLSAITLVPCTQDLLRQIPGSAVVQFLVYNEFEQRFSTSRTANCKAFWPLSQIDTNDPQRSIFSAGVAGTLVGQSRLNPIGSGLVGVAGEVILGQFRSTSGFNIHLQGDRDQSDIITIP